MESTLLVCLLAKYLVNFFDKFQWNGQEIVVCCAFTAKQILDPIQFKLAVIPIWTHSLGQLVTMNTSCLKHIYVILFYVYWWWRDRFWERWWCHLSVPFRPNILKMTNWQSEWEFHLTRIGADVLISAKICFHPPPI